MAAKTPAVQRAVKRAVRKILSQPGEEVRSVATIVSPRYWPSFTIQC